VIYSISAPIELIRFLWSALNSRRRKQLLALQLLGLVAAFGEVANLGALMPFLQLLSKPQEGLSALGPLTEPLRKLPSQNLLLVLGLGFISVVVVSTALRVLTILVQLRLTALISADLGADVFTAILSRPYPWHLRTNTSTVISYLTRDVEAICSSIQAMLLLAMNGLIVLLLSVSLIALAPAVMVVVATTLIAFYLVVFRITRAGLREAGSCQVLEYQRTLQVMQEGLGGIRDVLLDRSQPTFLQAFRKSNQRELLARASINSKAQVPRYLIEGFAMVLIVGVSLSLALTGQGIERMLPMLGVLALGAYRLLQPLQQCFGALSGLQANQLALQRLKPFFNEDEEGQHLALHGVPLRIDVRPEEPLLQLEKVSFCYSSHSSWVLWNLNFSIRTGERLAFVGTTGSGKSTISDLILGLLCPTQGMVLVHGQDLHGTPGLVSIWQEQVAHVPQQIYLSDASFAANIAFGVPEIMVDHQLVKRAAEQAHIAKLIEESPDGYATLVGERGVRLSGGQRQRIGIARALYKQAKLLILDEATSALDNRTEADVMAAIEALDSSITVILIAHRLTTVKRCDRVLLLENGQISASGRYQELLASHKGFRDLSSL
jgi:ABC-type multidrug transport system fused ATPase/permease subunit